MRCAAAGDVVAEFVDEQYAKQSERKGEAGEEEIGMMRKPGPRPQVAFAHHRRQAVQEVLHEARAVAVVVTTLARRSSTGKAYSRNVSATETFRDSSAVGSSRIESEQIQNPGDINTRRPCGQTQRQQLLDAGRPEEAAASSERG